MSNVAYLTCELKSRDLDSRLLVAAHLLKAGFNVIAGQQWAIFANAGTAPKGVVLFKSANQIQAREMARCKAGGHIIVTADEEVLASVDGDAILRTCPPEAIDNSDLFLFQNALHEAVVREAYPHVRGAMTGSLRVDLLSRYRGIYDAESSALRARGKYILVNTNYTMTNSVWGDVQAAMTIAEKSGVVDRSTGAGLALTTEKIKCEELNREHITALIRWMVAALPGYRVVVRPHPAENPATWNAIAGIEVVAGSNPIPWINGAELVIHSNCTTGLEAVLMGRPCVNLCPMPTAALVRQFVMHRVNYTVASSDEAAHAIRAFLIERRGPLVDYKPALDSYPSGAAASVAAAIIQAAQSLPATPKQGAWNRFPRKEKHKAKFTVSSEEFQSRLMAVGNAVGLERIQVANIDDSLFMLGLDRAH